jgi:hypothetical protein
LLEQLNQVPVAPPTSHTNDTVNGTANVFVPMSRHQRTAVVLLFSAYLILIAVVRRYDPTPTDDWTFPLLALYVGLLATPFIIFQSSLGWFHPVIFVSLMSFVALIQRFTLYAWGLDWHKALPARADELAGLIELQLMLYSLAIVSFYAGFFLAPRLPTPRLRLVAKPTRLVRKLIVVNLISLFAFLLFIATRGGLGAHIDSWARGRHAEFAGKHYQVAIMGLGTLACWLWLAYRRSALRSGAFWACVAIASVISFLVMGSRSSAIYPVFIGLMIWMLRERQMVYLPVVAGVVLAIYVVGALGSYRRSGWEGGSSWDAATQSGFVDTIRSSAEGEISQRATSGDTSLAIYSRVPDDVPLLYGSSYLAILTLPVPRAMWPGKPRQIGGIAGTTFFGQKAAGAPPGAVGEAYWNFHIPGVGLVFFLFGVFNNWIARTYRRHDGHPAAVVLYSTTLFSFSVPSTAAFTLWIISLASIVGVLVGSGALRIGSPLGARSTT